MSVFQGASVGVTLTANKSRYSRELRDAKAEMKAWQRTVDSSMGRASGAMRSFAKAGALALGAGLALTVREGINELNDMQKANAQTAAGLRSTGGVANVTAKQITDLSNALMLKSGVDDQAIQTGANLLLTFTKVRNEAGRGNDIFNQATKAALDLSVKGFGSVEGASKMLGKALQDPVKGIAALSRAGVTFSAQQKTQIKTMVEAGNTLGAQRMILAELETQVGGAAEAYGSTLAGKVGIAKEQFAGMSAELVGRAVPSFLKLMDATQGAIAQFDRWSKSAEGERAIAAAGNAALTAGRAIEFLGRTAASGIGFMARHETATKAAAIAIGGLLVTQKVAGALTFLNAAMGIAAARTVMFAQATKGATIAQRAMFAASMLNPITALAAGITLAVGALVAFNLRQKDTKTQTESTAASMRQLTSAVKELSGATLAFDESRLALKVARAGLSDAKARLAAATRGTREFRDASLALEQAQMAELSAMRQVNTARGTYEAKAESSRVKARELGREIRAEGEHLRSLKDRLAAATIATGGSGRAAATAAGKVRELKSQISASEGALRDSKSAFEKIQPQIAGFSSRTDVAANSALRLKDEALGLRSALSYAGSALSSLQGLAAQGVPSGRPNARGGRGAAKGGGGLSGLASRALSGARTQLAIDADPDRALSQAQDELAKADRAARAAATAASRRGLSAAQRTTARGRLATARGNVAAAGMNVAQKEQAKQEAAIAAAAAAAEAAAQAQREAAEAAEEAAREAAEAAEAQRLAAEQQRQAQIDIPRSALTLADAMRDLERSQAEATESVLDDIATRRQSLADEATRRSLIQGVLNRGDLTADERATQITALAASNRATLALTNEITELEKTTAATQANGGATLDEVTALLDAIRRGLVQERGNVGAPIVMNNSFTNQQQPNSFLESIRYKITQAGV